jgi:transposase
LGRSRGGYGTKVHLTCTDEDTPVAVTLTPGQAGDAPEFAEIFDESTKRVPDVEEVVADKGYDSWEIKDQVLNAGMPAHIPSKKTAKEPWEIDDTAYKERNRVERLVNKMKQFRRIATRYEKLKDCFLSVIHLALSYIRVKSIVNRT